MKKTSLFIALLLNVCISNAQTLFSYGNNLVGKEEFLRAFNKNKNPTDNKEKAIKEYLELYTRFKLKVQAAKDEKIDTLQQLEYDLQNFRGQIESGYLNDEKGVQKLLNEAFERSQKDIHLLHFYISISNKVNTQDSTKAYKALREVREELIKGKTDYDELVDEISEEIFKVKGTDLGYITALQIPYQFENIAYSLKPGEVSQVVRTKSGLHVFKNAEERKSIGRWRVAQILLAIPPDVSGDRLKKIEKLADSLYDELQKGADFSEMAKRYSNDKLTYLIGGEMPEFTTGKFEFPFEQKVFELKENGDITKPIFTGYGFHIVKRIQQSPTPTDQSADESFVYNLKQLLLQDNRIAITKTNFINDIKKKTNYKRNEAVKENALFQYADSVAENKEVGNYPINNTTIFSFSKQQVKGSDWLNFVKDYKLNQDVYKGENNSELFEKYINTATTEYYRNHLEEYNPDFKYQLQEFRDGNMLFEIMERNVWSKATSDSLGLINFYNTKKSKYLWAESAEAIIVNAPNAIEIYPAIDSLSKGVNWRKLTDENQNKLQIDSGRFEISQLLLPENTTIKEGIITKPLINKPDNNASALKILKLYPAGQQRSFEDAKGLVINDYQEFLENQWIEELRKKYPVKVNETVLKSLLK